jgi:hypothetical protein
LLGSEYIYQNIKLKILKTTKQDIIKNVVVIKLKLKIFEKFIKSK